MVARPNEVLGWKTNEWVANPLGPGLKASIWGFFRTELLRLVFEKSSKLFIRF